jgi:hypothetical protein
MIITMTTEERALVVGALDSLGVALADHDHQWTEGERAIYEESLQILWNTVEKYRQLSGEVAASGNAPTPANGAFNASSEEYQRIAREAAERIALAEPMILARRATFIFEAIEQAVAAAREPLEVTYLQHTDELRKQLAAEREALRDERAKFHGDDYADMDAARNRILDLEQQLAAEVEAKQKAIALTHVCLGRLREERRAIEDAHGKHAVPAYLNRCIDALQYFENEQEKLAEL